MLNLWSTRWGKILIVVGGGLLIGLLVFLGMTRTHYHELFLPVIYSLLAMALLWFGIDFAIRSVRRRKEIMFDAGIAAKEGIEDRRREWANWNAELKKQGIDRYELPFYLLVGEPQSGKSILLQNSDLHFPFGQTRLSGIGGTRGCDWWFTEEAVILDLAGRLFTHEGGASDEAEWQAFLELLCEYRPMCPANGILLVIPCDRLIQESPERAAAKANKIQGALLTLTNKIQARIPVYVVLTKADKVFGFAECVHRLEVEKRHEMFGWSRAADRFEAPFDLDETSKGFESMVERARLLRAQMLSSARIPDALAEVDRLYAFPDEFAALRPNLMVYLQRVFSESSLVDRLYFRGVYLTSGLQTGAPIAKVCADLFKGSRESDTRNLEALFTKQRAYFIKDLIRKRVFSERGLVRPTRGRVLRARRNAWIGYGVAASIAVLAIASSATYLFREKQTAANNLYGMAIARTKEIVHGQTNIPQVLAVLARIEQAIDWDRTALEKVYASSKSSFKELYSSVFDHRLGPKLRTSAEESISHAGKPEGYKDFEARLESVQFLMSDIDVERDSDRLLALMSPNDKAAVATMDSPSDNGGPSVFDLGRAIELRRHSPGATLQLPAKGSAGFSSTLKTVIRNTETLWDGALTQGERWQVVSELGYVLACQGLSDSYEQLRNYSPSGGSIHSLCNVFDGSYKKLLESEKLLTRTTVKGKETLVVIDDVLNDQLSELANRRAEFVTAATGEASDPGAWPQAKTVRHYVDTIFDERDVVLGGVAIFDSALSGLQKKTGMTNKAYYAPPTKLKEIINDQELLRVCDAHFLSEDLGNLDQLVDQIGQGNGLGTNTQGELAKRIFYAKCHALEAVYEQRYAHIDQVLEAFRTSGQDDAAVQVRAVSHLVALRARLLVSSDDQVSQWVGHVDDLLRECEAEMLGTWKRFDESKLENTAKIIDDLRKYLDSLYQVNDAHVGSSAGGAHETWISQVDAFLAQRIHRHQEAFQNHWGDLPSAERGTMVELAKNILDRIQVGNLNALMRKASPSLIDFRLLATNDVFKAFAQSRAAQKSFVAVSALPPGRSISEEDPFLTDFRELVKQFTNDERLADNGRKMAVFLSSALSKKPVPEDALKSHLVSLRSTFLTRMTLEVRKQFISDLKSLVKSNPILFIEIFAKESGEALDDTVLDGQASSVFDQGSTLDTLLSDYKLAPVDQAVPIWGDEKKLDGADKTYSDLLQFLLKLQAFLLGKEKTLADAKLMVVIDPQSSIPDTIWTATKARGGMQHFCFPISQTGEWQSKPIGESMSLPALAWDFHPRSQKMLKMRWSHVAGIDTAVAGPVIEIHGSFAPLRLAWEGKKETKGYKHSNPPPPSDLPAPFYVRFDQRDLPERCALPADLRSDLR